MANNVKWRHNTAHAHTHPTHSISNNQHNWENSNSTAIINKCFLFCLIFTQLLSIIKARQIRDIDSRWRYSTQNGNFVSFSIIHFLSISIYRYLAFSFCCVISVCHFIATSLCIVFTIDGGMFSFQRKTNLNMKSTKYYVNDGKHNEDVDGVDNKENRI